MTRHLLASTALAGLVALTGTQLQPPTAQAQAQTSAQDEEDKLELLAATPEACRRYAGGYRDEEEIVVTGSRLRSSEFSAVQDAAPQVSREAGALSGVAPPSPPPPSVRADMMYSRSMPAPQPRPNVVDRDRYEHVEINPVHVTTEDPVSTFSIDVDTASYAVVRNFLNSCELPPQDAVRVEEMINYFDYDYDIPDSMDDPFETQIHVTPNPWNSDTQLLHVGVQGYELAETERPRANLVFLIDVSGSMNSADKLPLAVQAMHMLVDELDRDDTVSIVVYAGAAGAVLPPTRARNARTIHQALDSLHAGGSTAGGAGLALAYDLAEQNFDEDAVNRVMLLTDGDFNVGVTNDERLEDFVSRKRESGIYLSVMGFGRGNYNDQMMQTIAQAGNGVAGYIDSRAEARRMLVEETFSALFPIANDVKIQIEFNPARVAEYRLVGYETRILNREDFNNDAVDAGEVGSGHSVTAIYEIAAPGSEGVLVEPLRYGGTTTPEADLDGEFGHLRIRYKHPGEDESALIEQAITDADRYRSLDRVSEEARFSIQVAGFAQLMRGDPYLREGYGYDQIIEYASDALGDDEFGHRAEFVELVQIARFASERDGVKVN
jgi:Ca-activated chloride channel family protein